MMTSVTLPSTSGPLHGGYSSVAEETTSSEPEFETPRPVKRCLLTSLNDSCKKRRKQSTPVRISSADTEPSLISQPLAPPSPLDQQLTTTTSLQQQQQQQTTLIEGKPSSSPSPEPELQCPVCQLYFNTSEQIQHHLITDHSDIECKKEPSDDDNNSYNNFTTTILNQQHPNVDGRSSATSPLELTSSSIASNLNRSSGCAAGGGGGGSSSSNSDCVPLWMNDLQGKEWINQNLHGLTFNPTTNPMFMGLPQFAHHQHDNLPRQPIRIFNPDAYCDLCNKEFCNKYFLKTHKANKHGIYSDPPSSEPLVNSNNSSNVNIASSYVGTIKLPTTVPSVVELPTIVKNEKAAAAAATLNINPFNNLFPNPFSNTTSSPPTTITIAASTTTATAPSTALSLSSSSSSSTATASTIVVNKSFNKQILSLTSKLQNLYESESNDTNTNHVPNSNGFSSISSDQSDKIVVSPDVHQHHQQLQNHDESSSPTTSLLHNNESTSFKLDPDNSSSSNIYYIPQIKLSPGNEIEMANRLRRIGVMNPKAFCEICCKEYCNKYFLRTHKMKRHGIYIPDDKDNKDVKIESASGSGNLPWQNNMQTSPLNLIMTEQSSQDRKTTSPSDIRCDICGIKFQNFSLFELHNVSVHGKLYVKDEDHTQMHQHQNHQINDSNKKDLTEQQQNNNNNKSMNAEAISEDLQKLQTMILQLNELDVSKSCTTCNACNKEFENRYYLHAHMMTEHGILLDDVGSDVDKPVESENTSSNNNTMCDLCGKDVQNVDEMKKHLQEFHPTHHHHQQQQQQQQQQLQLQQSIDSIKDEFNTNNGFTTGGTSSLSSEKNSNRLPTSNVERRISMNVTPTSSYCDICNKELCNKYFMKTHMQRMHGIEIENGAQIGGVICDICNKELCSKYFLRVHKHNTHGIVEYGTSLLTPRKNDTTDSSQASSTPHLPPEPDPSLKPADLADLSHRYFTHFTEVCSICSRRFRSTKWLKAHLLSDHGQMGAEKWAELEQQLQQTIGQHSKSMLTSSTTPSPSITTTTTTITSSSCAASSGGLVSLISSIKSERCSPTLKIPNGGQERKINNECGIQNVLSSIFGVDDSTAKNYQCSYCPFQTPLLPLLFVHERSHSMSSDGGPLKCPVCTQSFLQPELLQHHIFAQHPFLPLPPFFNGNNNTTTTTMSATTTTTTSSTSTNENCNAGDTSKDPSDCGDDIDSNDDMMSGGNKLFNNIKLNLLKQSCNNNNKGKGGKKSSTTTATTTMTTNNATTTALTTSGGIELSSDIGQSLKDVAKHAQVPTAYALPQGGEDAGYVMQAFLVEEAATEKRFVPTIVFLPVIEKQPAPLTVTFTLTPA